MRIALVGLVCCALSLVASHAEATRLRDLYPELAGRKDSLGAVALLTDASIYIDTHWDEKADTRLSRVIAEKSVALFARGLAAKGYRVTLARVASLGVLLPEETPFLPLSPGDREGYPVDSTGHMHAPFFLDTLVGGTGEQGRAWAAVARAMHEYVPDLPRPHPDSAVVRLAERLGVEALVIVTAAESRVSAGRQLTETTATRIAVKPAIAFSVLDGRTGRVLWHEATHPPTLSRFVLEEEAEGLLLNLP